MTTAHDSNQKPIHPQPLSHTDRLRKLKIWKLENEVTWVDMGRHMTALRGRPVTGCAVQKALEGERMPVANHAALLCAYPSLPPALLPRPEDTSKTYNPIKK